MSLRIRLMGLVALGLVLSLGLGGAVAWWNASRSVRTEMEAAIAVGEQTVRNAVDSLSRSSDPERELRHLVATFDGDRHLRAALFVAGDDGRLAPQAAASSFLRSAPQRVPTWFVRLLGAPAIERRLPVGAVNGFPGGVVLLETDSHNEAREIWSEFRDALLVLLLFCGQAVLLVDWSVRRAALRPLLRLAEAFERVGAGDYAARVTVAGPAEVALLAQRFNRMADRLADAELRNRRLLERIATLQEEERMAIARDLHDEVGPFLFAVNVDASAIARSAAKRDPSTEIATLVRSIQESVMHMQKHVKALLGRLRPAGLAQGGLAPAIENLVAFWRLRHPEIAFDLELGGGACAARFGENVEAAIYRVVQEGVTNAVRHGRPTRVEVALYAGRDEDDITVSVVDDGTGMPKSAEQVGAIGFGLLGMRERVETLGGSLMVSNRAGGGLAVVARWEGLRRSNGGAVPAQAGAA